MLVRFHSKASAGVLMFGDIAAALLRLMGMSGSVPGAVLARDVPEALNRLRQAIASAEGERILDPSRSKMRDDDADSPAVPPVKLRTRAYPLVQMLAAAAAAECDVIWEDADKATG